MKVVVGEPPFKAPLEGATPLDFSTGTWSTGGSTNYAISVGAVSPDSRYEGEGVLFSTATSYDPQFVWELAEPIPIYDFRLSFLMRMSAYPNTIATNSGMNLRLRAAIDAGLGVQTNYLEANRTIMPGRWTGCQIGGMADTVLSAAHRTGWTQTGTIANGATVKRLIGYMPGLTGYAGQMFMSQIAIGGKSKKIVSITADDGWVSYKTVAVPIMVARNIKSMQFLIGSVLGTPGYMTLAQAIDCPRDLVIFGNHTFSHWTSTTLGSKTRAEIRDDLLANDAMLRGAGLNSPLNSLRDVAWPYGADSRGTLRDNILGACEDAGIRSVRNTNTTLEGYGISDPNHGSCVFMDYTDANTRASVLIKRLRDFIKGDGGTFRIGFHDINDANTTSNGYPVIEFTAVMDFLAEAQEADEIEIKWESELQTAPILGNLKLAS